MVHFISHISTIASLSFLLAGSAVLAEPADIILPADQRFDVFEKSNSAGGGTFPSPVGTVILTFVSKDLRYCRMARFPADRTFVLACREEQGWKIEATSGISAAEADNPTSFGGSPTPEVGDAILALQASPEPLDEMQVIVAAARGWRDPAPVDEQAFDARQILGRTAMTYRASKSYVDSGVVKTVYTTKSGERIGETRFKTAYVAPADFRFESNMNDFGGPGIEFVVAHSENGLDVWFSSNPELMKDVASIQDALDAGAGISRDTSGMIPGLIFHGTKLGGDIVRLTDAVRIEDAMIDGADCFQVQGFRWPNTGTPTRVWIDKESFLIRRVYEEQELKDVSTRTTWSYKPAINVPVDESALGSTEPTL